MDYKAANIIIMTTIFEETEAITDINERDHTNINLGCFINFKSRDSLPGRVITI